MQAMFVHRVNVYHAVHKIVQIRGIGMKIARMPLCFSFLSGT